MKTNNKKDGIGFFLPWYPREEAYINAVNIDYEVIEYLIKKQKLSHARDSKELPKEIIGEIIVIPQRVSNQSVMVNVYTATPIPKNWLLSDDTFEANKSLMSAEIKDRLKMKNIEFSFTVEDDEFEYEEHQVIAVAF